MTALITLTIDDRARELAALAAYVYTGDIDPDVARSMAVRNWISAMLPDAPDRWDDYCQAVSLLADLDAGLARWVDVDPDLTGWGRHEVALELARDRTAEALFPLLFGPEAVPCRRCRQTARDVWQPAVAGGLCVECQGIEWLGGLIEWLGGRP